MNNHNHNIVREEFYDFISMWWIKIKGEIPFNKVPKLGKPKKKKRNTVGEKMSDAFGLFPKQQMM